MYVFMYNLTLLTRCSFIWIQRKRIRHDDALTVTTPVRFHNIGSSPLRRHSTWLLADPNHHQEALTDLQQQQPLEVKRAAPGSSFVFFPTARCAPEGIHSSNMAAPLPGSCGFFLEKKRRFCKMVAARGRRFCGEHATMVSSRTGWCVHCPGGGGGGEPLAFTGSPAHNFNRLVGNVSAPSLAAARWRCRVNQPTCICKTTSRGTSSSSRDVITPLSAFFFPSGGRQQQDHVSTGPQTVSQQPINQSINLLI